MTDAQYDAAIALLTRIQDNVRQIRSELANASACVDRMLSMFNSFGSLKNA